MLVIDSTLVLLSLIFYSVVSVYQNKCRLYAISPDQLNLKSDYTFIIDRNPNLYGTSDPNYSTIPTLQAGSYVILTFPSPSWSSQSNLNCIYQGQQSQQTSCTLVDSLNLKLTTMITQAINQGGSATISLTFDIQNVLNPGQTGPTNNIDVNIYNPSGTLIETCSGSNKLTSTSISAGTLVCTASAISGVVGLTANIQLNATILDSIPQNVQLLLQMKGYFVIIYSNTWSNDIVNTQIAISSSGSSCSAISVNGQTSSSLQLTCLQTSSQYTSSLFKFAVSNMLSITFGLINVPSSVSNSGTLQLQTFDNNGLILDKCDSLTVSNWLPNVIGFTSFKIGSNGIVNSVASASVIFKTTTQLQKNDLIDVTFPGQINIGQLSLIQDQGQAISLSSVYHMKDVTLSGQTITFVAPQGMKPGTTISLVFMNLMAPTSTQPTDSMIFQTRRSNNLIDQLNTGAIFIANPGQLSLVTIVPDNLTIYANSPYQIQFTTTNALLSDAYLTILFPSPLVISTSATCQITSGSPFKQNPTSCTIDKQLITIKGIATNSIAANTQITLRISSVQNQDKSTSSNYFTITTFYSLSQSPYSVDTSSTGVVTTYTHDFLNVSKINVTTSNTITGQLSIFNFTFCTTNPIPVNGYVVITLPQEVVINDATQLQNACLFGTLVTRCSQIATSPYQIQIIIPSLVAANSNVTLQIVNQLFNPRSTKQSSTFQIATYTNDNLMIDLGATAITITMTIPTFFSTFLLLRSNQMNGATSSYTFTINFNITQDAGTYLELNFPSNIGIPSSLVCSSSVLASNLNCQKINAFSITVVLQPRVANGIILANTATDIQISSLVNPLSFLTAYSIVGKTYILSGSSTYQSSLSKPYDAINVTDSQRNSIVNGLVSTQQSFLDEIDVYTLSFGLTNPIKDNATIQIQIPNQVYNQLKCQNLVGFPSGTTCSIVGLLVTLYSSAAQNQFSNTLSLSITGLTNPTVVLGGQFVVTTYQDGYPVDLGNIGQFQAKCQLPCRTCQGTTCLSCYSDPSFTQNQIYYNSGSGQCAAFCLIGFFQPDLTIKQCAQCSSLCASCAVTYNYCLSCPGVQVIMRTNSTSDCRDQCPLGYYKDQVTNQCDNCPLSCASCNSTNTCQSCTANYFLNNQNCLSQCPVGISVPNFKNQTCDLCTNNCQTCQNFTSFCLTCVSNFVYSANTCNTSCPNGTYLSGSQCLACAFPCNTCQSTANLCTSCLSNSFLYNSLCITQCPDGLFKQNSKCVGCTSPCLTCSSTPDLCTSCDPNTKTPYLLNQACLTSCPVTYYPSLGDGKCVLCQPPCLTCSLQNKCLSCFKSTQILYGTTCVDSCPLRYYQSGQVCQQCLDGCLDCDSSKCIQCTTSYFSLGEKCVQNCPSGFQVSNDGNACQQNSTNTNITLPVQNNTQQENIVQDNLKSSKYIPVPFCCACFLFLLTVIVAKFQIPETFMPGAIVGFCGILEWGSWITLLFLTYKQLGFHRSLLPQIVGILINLFLNIINLFFYKRNIHSDPEFQKWLSVTNLNKSSNIFITTFSLLLSFKASKFLFSKYFGFKFFKAKLTSLTQLLPFNVISLVSIFICSLPLIIGGVLVMYDDDATDQLFVSALDCVIVTGLLIVAILWEGQKHERFFLDEDGHILNFNQMVKRALHPDYEHGQPDSDQVEDSRIVVSSPKTRKRASDQLNQSILDRTDQKLIQQNSLETEPMKKEQGQTISSNKDEIIQHKVKHASHVQTGASNQAPQERNQQTNADNEGYKPHGISQTGIMSKSAVGQLQAQSQQQNNSLTEQNQLTKSQVYSLKKLQSGFNQSKQTSKKSLIGDSRNGSGVDQQNDSEEQLILINEDSDQNHELNGNQKPNSANSQLESSQLEGQAKNQDLENNQNERNERNEQSNFLEKDKDQIGSSKQLQKSNQSSPGENINKRQDAQQSQQLMSQQNNIEQVQPGAKTQDSLQNQQLVPIVGLQPQNSQQKLDEKNKLKSQSQNQIGSQSNNPQQMSESNLIQNNDSPSKIKLYNKSSQNNQSQKLLVGNNSSSSNLNQGPNLTNSQIANQLNTKEGPIMKTNNSQNFLEIQQVNAQNNDMGDDQNQNSNILQNSADQTQKLRTIDEQQENIEHNRISPQDSQNYPGDSQQINSNQAHPQNNSNEQNKSNQVVLQNQEHQISDTPNILNSQQNNKVTINQKPNLNSKKNGQNPNNNPKSSKINQINDRNSSLNKNLDNQQINQNKVQSSNNPSSYNNSGKNFSNNNQNNPSSPNNNKSNNNGLDNNSNIKVGNIPNISNNKLDSNSNLNNQKNSELISNLNNQTNNPNSSNDNANNNRNDLSSNPDNRLSNSNNISSDNGQKDYPTGFLLDNNSIQKDQNNDVSKNKYQNSQNNQMTNGVVNNITDNNPTNQSVQSQSNQSNNSNNIGSKDNHNDRLNNTNNDSKGKALSSNQNNNSSNALNNQNKSILSQNLKNPNNNVNKNGNDVFQNNILGNLPNNQKNNNSNINLISPNNKSNTNGSNLSLNKQPNNSNNKQDIKANNSNNDQSNDYQINPNNNSNDIGLNNYQNDNSKNSPNNLSNGVNNNKLNNNGKNNVSLSQELVLAKEERNNSQPSAQKPLNKQETIKQGQNLSQKGQAIKSTDNIIQGKSLKPEVKMFQNDVQTSGQNNKGNQQSNKTKLSNQLNDTQEQDQTNQIQQIQNQSQHRQNDNFLNQPIQHQDNENAVLQSHNNVDELVGDSILQEDDQKPIEFNTKSQKSVQQQKSYINHKDSFQEKCDMETPKNINKNGSFKTSKQQINQKGQTDKKSKNTDEVQKLLPLVEDLETIQDIGIENLTNTRSLSPISKVDQTKNTQMEINPLNSRFYNDNSKKNLIQSQTADPRQTIEHNESLRSLSDALVDYNEVSPSDFNAMNQRFEEDFYDSKKPKVNNNKGQPPSHLDSTNNPNVRITKQNFTDKQTQRSSNIKKNIQIQQPITQRRLNSQNNEDENDSDDQFKKSVTNMENEDNSFDDQKVNNRRNPSVEKKQIDRQKLKGLEAIYLQRIDNNIGKSQIKSKKKKAGKTTPPKQGIDKFFIDDDIDELAF